MTPQEIIERLPPFARLLLDKAADVYGVAPELIVGHCRLKPIALARHAWWAALYGLFPHWSFPYIGALTGHDHTSVMYGRAEYLKRGRQPLMLSAPAPIVVAIEEKVA